MKLRFNMNLKAAFFARESPCLGDMVENIDNKQITTLDLSRGVILLSTKSSKHQEVVTCGKTDSLLPLISSCEGKLLQNADIANQGLMSLEMEFCQISQ